MISLDDFAALKALRWRARYERLAEMAREEQARMKPGQVLGTAEFVCQRLFPQIPTLSKADQTEFYHWITTTARYNNVALAKQTETPTRGYNKGRQVTRYLWGRPFNNHAFAGINDLLP